MKLSLHMFFLINRLPSKVIDDQTPFECLLGTQPDYTFLRTFGCAVWPNLRPYNSKNFEFHSKQCVFLGYSPIHKGFKCLDPKEGHIYVSHDVIFDEHVFLFAALSPNVGARLRSELALHPDILKNSSSIFWDAKLCDQHLSSPALSNRASSPSGPLCDARTNDATNGGEYMMNRQHFVCALGRSSAPIEVDAPAAVLPGPGGFGTSSPGSAPAPRSGVADLSTRGGQSTHAVGSSAVDPSATSTPDPQLVP
jgi:hypothetical protein